MNAEQQRRFSKIQEVLIKTGKFKDALETETGKLLLEDLIAIIEEKIILVYEFKATEIDKSMLKACTIIGNRWSAKLRQHKEACEKITKG